MTRWTGFISVSESWTPHRPVTTSCATGVLSIVCLVVDDSEWAGIGTFNATMEEVARIMVDDPGVRAGVFTYEVHPIQSFPAQPAKQPHARTLKTGDIIGPRQPRLATFAMGVANDAGLNRTQTGHSPTWHCTSDNPHETGKQLMVILLALLLVLLFFGLGFALHLLWIVAVVLFVVWLIGLALGRGESAGSHRFYRW